MQRFGDAGPPPSDVSIVEQQAAGATMPCVCSAVRRVDRALNRLYDDALRPSGLATTQFALLSVLSRARRPLPHRELAALQGMAAATLSRNLQPLARDGLIRIDVGEDRRTRSIAITPRGERALAGARPLWQSVQERVVTELGEARAERLLTELSDVLALLRQAGHDDEA